MANDEYSTNKLMSTAKKRPARFSANFIHPKIDEEIMYDMSNALWSFDVPINMVVWWGKPCVWSVEYVSSLSERAFKALEKNPNILSPM